MDKKTTPWIIVAGYCATRYLADADHTNPANRIAFIEKTPRVRIAAFTNADEDSDKWFYGPKGQGGGWDEDHEKEGNYGFHPESRQWCDRQLIDLGYTIVD